MKCPKCEGTVLRVTKQELLTREELLDPNCLEAAESWVNIEHQFHSKEICIIPSKGKLFEELVRRIKKDERKEQIRR